MHTVWRMVPADTLREHPEWAAEAAGLCLTPVNANAWDLCYTNAEARRFLVERTTDWARRHPDCKTVWIGQNDSPVYCSCRTCSAFYHAHGDRPSAAIVQLVNELAEAETRSRYGRLATRLLTESGADALGERKRLDPAELALDKMGISWPAIPLRDGGVEALVVPGVGGLVTDLRDTVRGFAPLKPCWGGLILRYRTPDQHGMLRLFLRGQKAGEAHLDYSLRLLPDAATRLR